MTLSDLLKLIRHYAKIAVALPIACAIIAVVVSFLVPQTYEAKSTLLTNGDIGLAGGFAQSEAEALSQDGITVTSKTDTASRTITVTAESSNYDASIEAANKAVLAAAEDMRSVDGLISVSTNEATYAESVSPGIPAIALIALVTGIFLVICIVLVLDAMKAPIRSQKDVEELLELPVIGNIPNRDRGERLLANVRFSTDERPSTIAVVPTGLTGATLTCAELASAFEHSGTGVCRVKGSPHAESINEVALPGMVTIIECAPISEGMGAVYIAKEADLTILCVREWADSRRTLASVMGELEFAQSNVGGAVYLSAK